MENKFFKKNLKFFTGKFSLEKAAAIAAWIIFAAILAGDALVVRKSFALILGNSSAGDLQKKQGGVRVDFESYDKVIGRIAGAAGYSSGSTTPDNPFRPAAGSGQN